MERTHASTTDALVANNAAYAATFDAAHLPMVPRLKIAVLACMDPRLDLFGILGLHPGDAHVLRNAGGVVTDAEIRALALSQRRLGTREIVLIQHTNCAALGLDEEEFRNEIWRDVGLRPTWSATSFRDLEGGLRASIDRIRTSPFIPHKDGVRGFIYDVDTGLLREID